MPQIVGVGQLTINDTNDGLSASLSNEGMSLPADSTGAVSSYAGCSTTMFIYLGGTDDSPNWTVTAAPSSGVVGAFGTGVALRTYTVTSLTANSAYVDLSAAKAGYPTITKRFSLSISKAGQDGTSVKGDPGAEGLSYVKAYCASTTANTTTPPPSTKGKATLPPDNSGGLVGTYVATVPSLTSSQRLWVTDGQYNPATDYVTWSIPYWSSLKVGNLSAISADLGTITAGSMDIGTGSTSWHVDSAGNQWSGNASYASAPFKVSNTGAVTASNLTITGGKVDIGTGSTSWHIDSTGNQWVGDSSYTTAPFKISNAGAVVASNLTLTGAGGLTVIDPTGLKAGFEAPGTKNTDQKWVDISGTGKPADNASSDITLVGRGVAVTGNSLAKTTATNSFDSDAYSIYGYVGGAYASAVAVDNTHALMFGLDADPTADSAYQNIDYSVYLRSDGAVWTYESGSSSANGGVTYVAGDVFMVAYDGSTVRYFKNGTVFRTTTPASPITSALYFDSSFSTLGGKLSGVRFGPLTSNNWASIGGPGKPFDGATPGAVLALSDFRSGLSTWTSSRFGDPTTVATAPGTLITNDTDFGTCGEYTFMDVGGENVLTKGAIDVVPGRVYRISSVFKCTALPDGLAQYTPVIEHMDSAYGHLAASFPTSVNVDTVNKIYTLKCYASSDLLTGVQQFVAGTRFFRAGLRLSISEATAPTVRLKSVTIEDVTDAYNAQVTADAAMASINNISSDNVLSKGEKSQVILDWNAINQEKNGASGLDLQADALGVPRTTYDSAADALYTYLQTVAYSDTSTDTVIDGPTFRTKFADYYTAKQNLINAMAVKASTLSTWAGVTGTGKPADNATVGADSTNLNIGLGGKNMIPCDTLPSSAASFVKYLSTGAFTAEGPWFAGPSDTFGKYSPGKAGTAWIHAYNTPTSGTYIDLYVYGDNKINIQANKKYEASVTLSAHRCSSTVMVIIYDSTGAIIASPTGNAVTLAWSTDNTGAFPVSSVIFTTPANASTAKVLVRQNHNGGTDPYTFTSQWYLGEAMAAQTVASPWSPSSNSLTGKLNADANSILTGSMLISSAGGIGVGSLTWNSTGGRTAGYGIGITSSGIAAYNSSGVATFTLNASNGSAYFSGTIGAGTVMSQNLSSLSATIGTLRTAASGARTEISDNVIKVYDSSNVLRVKIGDLAL